MEAEGLGQLARLLETLEDRVGLLGRLSVTERAPGSIPPPSRTLDPHHILYKSRGGSDDPSNIVSLCRIHHALIHKGTCSVTGRVGVDLKFERPQLVTEKPAPEVEQAPIAEPLELPEEDDGSEDWRDETVAAIFDGPPSPPPAERTRDYGDVIDAWGAQQLAFERERRSRRRRASEHVFAEASVDDATAGSPDRASPDG